MQESIHDVAVIGLGAMGAATLFQLAERGQRVIGIERFQPGHDRGSSHGESRAIRLGYSESPQYVPLLRRAYAYWRELEQLTGETLLLTSGILEMGMPGSRLVAGTLKASEQYGLDHEVLSPREVQRRYPAIELPQDYSSVWQPDAGILRSDAINALHIRHAIAQGAQVVTNARVLAIEPRGRRRATGPDDGRAIEAGSVVVCAGPWTSDLVPSLKSTLTLTRAVSCWYRPKRPELFKSGALPVFMIDDGRDFFYGFPDFGDVGLKCGSHYGTGQIQHADLARQDASAPDENHTRDYLERYMPEGAGPLLGMKTCLYTMTPDTDFIIDTSPEDDRIVVVSPCSGHGFKFAGVVGEIAADLAISGDTEQDISRFRIDRFPA